MPEASGFNLTTTAQVGYLPAGFKSLTAQFLFELEHAINRAIGDGFLMLAEKMPRLSGETSASFNNVSQEFGVAMPYGKHPSRPEYKIWPGWAHKFGVTQDSATHTGVRVTRDGIVDWHMTIHSEVFNKNEYPTEYNVYWLPGHPVWEPPNWKPRQSWVRSEPWGLLPEFKEVVVNYMRGPAIDNVANGIKRGLKTGARIERID